MREKEKNLNIQDDQKNISTPIFLAAALVVVLVGTMIWFGIKDPEIFGKMRDLLVTLTSVILLIIALALAVLCFFLASRLSGAKKQVDESLSAADGKVEEIAVKIEEILRKILDPFIQGKSKAAGIMHILRKKKTEE